MSISPTLYKANLEEADIFPIQQEPCRCDTNIVANPGTGQVRLEQLEYKRRHTYLVPMTPEMRILPGHQTREF